MEQFVFPEQVREHVMDCTCSKNGGEEECTYRILVGKASRKVTTKLNSVA
jgi:hypothetical protein